MGPRERLWAGLVILILTAGGFAAGRIVLRPELRVEQPIAFNHSKHVELLDCEFCHPFYSERAHSGLPGLSTCLECHEEPQTDMPEEEKVRTLAASGEDEVFRKLFRLPDHTYYSHRRHVAIAGLDCETCHGAIAKSEVPPERPLVRVSMQFCLDCHRREEAATNCTACHR